MSSVSPPASILPHISIDSSFGSLLIGTFIGLFLYGIVVHQTYRYITISTWSSLSSQHSEILSSAFIAIHRHSLLLLYLHPSPMERWLRYCIRKANCSSQGLIVGISQAWKEVQSLGDARCLLLAGRIRFLCWLTDAVLASSVVEIQYTSKGLTGFVDKTVFIHIHGQIVDFSVRPSAVGPATAISVVVTKRQSSILYQAQDFVTDECSVYANALLAALNSRRSLQYRSSTVVMGADIFGSEDDTAQVTKPNVPVSIELRANIIPSHASAPSRAKSHNGSTYPQSEDSEKRTEITRRSFDVQRDVMEIC
ncbi:hypothetical protein DICSQDRAFT_130206 [Dichomitus squalens LYAD-421 SS1]|uniref:Uncharacterized protein n=1 Tax=Dichomitus squalens (strain LYAD-421) TaxID=732165 RepID=R7SMK7_DICSQ|nr:uncharacterized protein DICSQDRAFT_130206 [Dichomitus squalens LYAD-421 SS1]EJF56212.1 hypothetical protein DICSQDRAFT_130206 [Dichomitus squalens LYAD-421 SS1]